MRGKLLQIYIKIITIKHNDKREIFHEMPDKHHYFEQISPNIFFYVDY